MHFSELTNRYNAGERDFEGIDCQGDLIAGRLPGVNLSGANIPSTNLEDSDLAGANLSKALVMGQLRRINLSNANLQGTQFSYTHPISLGLILASELKYANLEKASLVSANLQKVSLIDANLKAANLHSANLKDADLRGADLHGADLTEANLEGANLCQANLTEAILTEQQLETAILGWTILPNGSISNSSVMDLIASKLKHLKRPAWKPITARHDGAITASKFAGRPWLSADEAYPLCPMCQTPLRFFLQLNLEELPQAAHQQFGKGLLQLFYCTNEADECDVWEPFSPCKLVRIVQPTGSPSQAALPIVDREIGSALIEGEFSARHIVRWQAMATYPEWHEVELSEKIQLSADECLVLSEAGIEDTLFGYDISEFMDTTMMCPTEGDRLAGYPRWLQEVEYPSCPICNRLMDNLIFEFASDDNVPYLWGDAGTGYVLQCPEHKQEVTFIWQCG